MTKKSPPLSPFLQRTRPAGKSISSTRVRMKRSSSSLQPAKSGTARSRATRASATRAVYPRLCDALPRGVDLADERRAHPVGELALVIGVEDQQVGTASGDEGAGPSAATERVCRVDRRAADRLVRREAAERDPEGDRRGHAFDRRGTRVVIRPEPDGDARGALDERVARLRDRLADHRAESRDGLLDEAAARVAVGGRKRVRGEVRDRDVDRRDRAGAGDEPKLTQLLGRLEAVATLHLD